MCPSAHLTGLHRPASLCTVGRGSRGRELEEPCAVHRDVLGGEATGEGSQRLPSPDVKDLVSRANAAIVVGERREIGKVDGDVTPERRGPRRQLIDRVRSHFVSLGAVVARAWPSRVARAGEEQRAMCAFTLLAQVLAEHLEYWDAEDCETAQW